MIHHRDTRDTQALTVYHLSIESESIHSGNTVKWYGKFEHLGELLHEIEQKMNTTIVKSFRVDVEDKS